MNELMRELMNEKLHCIHAYIWADRHKHPAFLIPMQYELQGHISLTLKQTKKLNTWNLMSKSDRKNKAIKALA